MKSAVCPITYISWRSSNQHPVFGARPVKRVIQQMVENPLATELLRGEYPEGSTIAVDVDGDQFTFTRQGGDAPE